MPEKYLLAFVPMFVAVDALGILPVFLSLTQRMNAADKARLVRRSTLIALVVAGAFVGVGRFVFQWLGITVSDFLVAGGSVLFVVSIRDLLSYEKGPKIKIEDIGVVPLAVPLMVGPAVFTTSLVLLNTYGILPTVFSLTANILVCGGVLFLSGPLSRLLGETGSQTLSKISSLFLAAIAVMLIRRGLGIQ